ncbi:MAG: hypothetical protein JXQ73_29685 [Phycisphaerae bacterium]|nr:hypothetical protein [Phycisphaerae bacterium]
MNTVEDNIDRDVLAARILLRGALPLLKVLLNEDPAKKAKFAGLNAVVQFAVKGSELGSYLEWIDGELDVKHEIHPNPTIAFRFGTPAKLVAFLTGKTALPSISGWYHLGLLLKVVPLLLSLKMLMPNVVPTEPDKKALKVKLLMYMVTTALSQLNKGGEPEMVKFCAKSPDRIYQWSVTPDGPYAYLRIKAGKTKAGRGVYARRRPFVHMKFNGIDGAFAVMTSQVDTVEAVKCGHLELDGSPEYAKEIGVFMKRIEGLIA